MRTRGYTLLELLVVLSIVAGLLTVTVPPTAAWLDELAVRAARDDLASALALTRITAAARGGATLHLVARTGSLTVESAAGERRALGELVGRYRVTIGSDPAARYSFRYDGVGLGRFANRTVSIHRGDAVAGVTVSAYGRFRRW